MQSNQSTILSINRCLSSHTSAHTHQLGSKDRLGYEMMCRGRPAGGRAGAGPRPPVERMRNEDDARPRSHSMPARTVPPALCGPAARHLAHSSHHQALDNPNHDRRASRCQLRPLAFDRSETRLDDDSSFHRRREGEEEQRPLAVTTARGQLNQGCRPQAEGARTSCSC